MKLSSVLELVILLLASLWPMFALASQIDSDEFVKGGMGAASATIALTVYERWKKNNLGG